MLPMPAPNLAYGESESTGEELMEPSSEVIMLNPEYRPVKLRQGGTIPMARKDAMICNICWRFKYEYVISPGDFNSMCNSSWAF